MSQTKAITKTADETGLQRVAVGTEQALVGILEKQLVRFKSLAPTHLPPHRLARLALEASREERTKEQGKRIIDCTPASIIKALIDCAVMGLEPTGKGGVHLVPWENKGVVELNAITDYRGEMLMAYRSGFVRDIRARSVHDGDDHFRYVEGDEERIEHTPNLDLDRYDPSTLRIVYSIVEMSTGGKVRKLLNKAGVERFRQKSKAKNGPWRLDGADYVPMALKTVIRRAMNEVPQSAEYRTVLANEEARELGLEEPSPVIIDVKPAELERAQQILEEARGGPEVR